MPRHARLDSPNFFFGKKGHAIFDGEINDLKSLDEALELGVVQERGKGLAYRDRRSGVRSCILTLRIFGATGYLQATLNLSEQAAPVAIP